MTLDKGQLIIIEGTDGSGKKTQAALLIERLKKEGRKAISKSFPQYGTKSAGPTEEFLSGKYGKPTEIDPYVSSVFYAVDRFDLSQELKNLLEADYIVILDRYVDSNVGHQGGKIKNSAEREKYVEWLYDFEYRIMNIPKPDLVLVLHVPAEFNEKLVSQKQTLFAVEKNHELGLEHLKNAEAAYIWLAQKYPDDHKVVECVENETLLSPEKVHEKVWSIINKFLKA